MLAVLLVLVLTMGLMPTTVFAVEDDFSYVDALVGDEGEFPYIDADISLKPEALEPESDEMPWDDSDFFNEEDSVEGDPEIELPELEIPDDIIAPDEDDSEPEVELGSYETIYVPEEELELPVAASGDMITVYISFEGYNLGHGFYIEPVQLEVPDGTLAGTVTREVLTREGYTYELAFDDSFLDGIIGFNRAYINPPSYITISLNESDADPSRPISAFMFSSQSGWMFTVNHEMADAMNEVELTDGDVIRWQFSVQDFGADLGIPSDFGAPLYTHADKTALIRALFASNVTASARQDALNVIINPVASAADVAAALAALQGTQTSPNDVEYVNGWYIVHNPNGQLVDMLLAFVESENGLTPLPPGTGTTNAQLRAELGPVRTRLAVVERLKVTGEMAFGDFLDSRGGNNVMNPVPGAFSDFNDNAAANRPILNGIIEMDLSEVTVINGTGPIYPIAAFRGLQNIRVLRLPSHIGLSASMFIRTPNLSTVAFGDSDFVDDVIDFTGLDELVFTNANTFSTSGVREIIFPAGVTNIPNNMFSANSNLHTVRFYDDNAPTIGNNTAFGNHTPRPVAIVPDSTTGGYELPAFFNHFLRVESRDVETANREALRAAINEANALNGNLYTTESWDLLQAALLEAETVVADMSATQAQVDSATADLRAAINALVVAGNDVTFINVPEGAEVRAVRKGTMHFQAFTAFPISLDTDLSENGRYVYRAAIPTGTTFHIEAFVPGETALLARRFNALTQYGTTITLNPIPLNEWNHSNPSPWMDDNVYTNLDDTGVVNLQVGGVFDLDTFRVWQAMAGVLENYFVEPVYEYQVLGSNILVEPIGGAGREQFRITAQSPGVSVIKITYGPIEYVTAGGASTFFNAMDSRNTLAVVVNVGGGSNFDTGMTVRNDFDTWYFDQDIGYAEFTFTPAAGSAVRVHDPLNIASWGSGWENYTASDDGSFTVQLKDGRNIIEVTNGSSIRHQVVRARGVSVDVTNETRPGQDLAVNDVARIEIVGISDPIEKLAGIYNPSPGAAVSLTDGEVTINSNEPQQFQSLTTTLTLRHTLTDVSLNVLTGSIIGGGGFGDLPGSHRNIPLTGRSANMSAVTVPRAEFGAAPVIVLPVEGETDKDDLIDVIEDAEALIETDFTPASWAILMTALNAANLVRDDANATQAEVNAAEAALLAAIDNLVPLQGSAPDWEAAMNDALADIYRRRTSPSFGQEWSIMALARSNFDVRDGFFDSYNDSVDARITSPRVGAPSTDNSRVVLALSSIGRDSSDIGGHNLIGIGGLADLNWATGGTRNNPTFALIAFDTNRFELLVPGANVVTRDALIESILNNEATTGGWSLSPTGTVADVDVTAMAIQALAPYYGSRTDVRDAVNRALNWLSTRQNDRGNFVSEGFFGVENSQSTAQVIIALAALGIDAQDDSRFIRNDINPIEALLAYQDPRDGGFRNQWAQVTSNAASNAMATDQASLALVAYWRLVNNMNSLYDMRDAFPSAPIVNRDELNAAITAAGNRIPANYTANSWQNMQTALTAAITVRDNNTATQAQVDTAATALRAAIDALVAATPTVNRTELNAAITDAGNRIQANYTANSWQNMQTALTAAIATRDNNTATQAQVDSAATALRAAIDALVVATPTARASISVRDPNASGTQTSVFLPNQEFDLLPGETAYSLLRRTNLNIDSRGSSDDGMYVAFINGWGEFSDGPLSGWMFRVNGVFPDFSSSLFVLSDGDNVEWLFTRDLGNDLNNNMNGTPTPVPTNTPIPTNTPVPTGPTNTPTPVPTGIPVNRNELNAAITAAQNRLQANYTANSWQSMQSALTAAGTIRDNAGATQAQVDAAAAALRTAIGNLQPLQGWEPAMNRVLANIHGRMTNPGFGDEWNVMALARSNFNVRPGFFEGYYDRVVTHMAGQSNPSRVSGGQSTDTSRAIIALSSIGRDATNIGGRHNLISAGGLGDLNWINGGTINNPVFALIALDTNMYTLPAGATTTRDALIQSILDLEIAGGGWALTGTTPDIDITSMVLQALTPYRDRPAVAAAINRALNVLSTRQSASGGWESWGNENSQSIAQVIVALTALGINPSTDARFIKNGNTPITALLAYQHQDGGFRNTWTQVVNNAASNPMATEQAAYALVAYSRFRNSMNRLYDMRDAFGAATTPTPQIPTATPQIPTATPTPWQPTTPTPWQSPTPIPTPTTILPTITPETTQTPTPAPTGTARASISVTDPNASGTQTRVFSARREFDLEPGETAYSLLRRTGLNIQSTGSSDFAGRYVQSINGWGEFSDGPLSGWMFRVNGRFPDFSSSLYTLSDGDNVEWLFTRNLGNDLGHNFGGGAAVPEADDDEEETNDAGGPNDRAALNSEIARARGFTAGNYTSATWTAMQSALSAAEAVRDNPNATQAQIDAAVNRLRDAINALEARVGVVIPPTVDQDGTTAVAEADTAIINDLIGQAVDAGATEIMTTIPVADGVNNVSLELIVGSIQEIASNGLSLTVQSDIATITLDTATLIGLARGRDANQVVRIVAERLDSTYELNTVQQAIVGNNLLVRLSVFVGNERISNFEGNATIAIPFVPTTPAEDHDLLTVYHLQDNGNIREMVGAGYHGSQMIFTTNHFSLFFVTEWINPFVDVARDAWHFRSVRFAFSNNLMVGTGGTTFSPDMELTRAMIVTILWRMAGSQASANNNAFSDVGTGQWYSAAVAWASENDIVSGMGNGRFAPADVATREQFATILRNYARSQGIDTTSDSFISEFTDTYAVSSWAMDAMQWANANGIISGRTLTTLVPRGMATRAETATMIRQFVENLT